MENRFFIHYVKYTQYSFRSIKKNKMTLNSVKYFVFHQASKTVIDNLVRKLNLPKKKFL